MPAFPTTSANMTSCRSRPPASSRNGRKRGWSTFSAVAADRCPPIARQSRRRRRSQGEHTSELQSLTILPHPVPHQPAFCPGGYHGPFCAHEPPPATQALALSAMTLIMAKPNACHPNDRGEYDELPHQTAGLVEEWAKEVLVNILGGCCGSTPAHIAAIAKAVEGLAPHRLPAAPVTTRLAGLETMTLPA